VLRSNRPYYDPDGTIPLDDILTLQDYFLKRGQLEYTTPIDMKPFVDPSLGEKALQGLGPYVAPTGEATMAATTAK
jgi:hypothetical protein